MMAGKAVNVLGQFQIYMHVKNLLYNIHIDMLQICWYIQ
jgi:hypothetical protein